MKVALFSKSVNPNSISFVKELVNQLNLFNTEIFCNSYVKDIAADVLNKTKYKVFDLNWEIPSAQHVLETTWLVYLEDK